MNGEVSGDDNEVEGEAEQDKSEKRENRKENIKVFGEAILEILSYRIYI